MALIELDPGGNEMPVARHRGRGWTMLLTGVVIGGVAGGLAVHRWQAQQTRDQVGLVVLADAEGWIGDRVEPGGTGSARIYGHVAVVNAGPATVKVRGVRSGRDGVTLTGSGVDRWVEPAGFVYTSFEAEVPCAGVDLAAMPVVVGVEPRDAGRRDVTVRLDGHPWERQFKNACEG